MEEMYGLMNYHHHHQQVTQSAEEHVCFDDHEQPRQARQQQQQQRVVPVLFGSGSSIDQTITTTTTKYKNKNNNNDKGLADQQQLEEDEFSSANRAKIMSHPLYPKLLQAYISCQKVGAPPDIANLFDEIFRDNDFCTRSSNNACSCLGDDPELDEFMETYCEMLDRYRSDLARPFDEATMFLSNMQSQLTNLCKGTTSITSDESVERSSEEDTSNKQQQGEADVLKNTNSWGTNEDRALKDRLLRKYSKYISSLKHEFSNKKKKGKLPKEARQVLLDWWNVHYRWPYPTEADKIALAESTGLDQKQINNWFINQRKRHWKPSENMQFAVMDSLCGSFIINN